MSELQVHLNQNGVRVVMHPALYAGPVVGKPTFLGHLVAEMADWDIPCPKRARALSLKIVPGTSPILVINYCVPPILTRYMGPHVVRQTDRRNCATTLNSGIVIVAPREALGVIVIRLKAEAAADLLGGCMRDLLDMQIKLDDLFASCQIQQLEDFLERAGSSAERFAGVERFLQMNLRSRRPAPAIAQAAVLLRRSPQLRVHELAAEINVSERQLLRNFYAVFGMGTKQFARIVRLEMIMGERARGASWADIAYKAGFTDQAHMVNEFTQIVGVSPVELIRPPG
jgi:AraC-like DNA-binding protein